MSNKGLKNVTKQLSFKESSRFNTYLNLSKKDANIIFDIPFINISGKFNFNIDLIYNYQDRNIDDADVTGVQTCALPIWNIDDAGVGYGFRFSFYTKIEYVSSSRYQITNSDGSIDYYDYDSSLSRYVNEENKNSIVVTSTSYTIYDKYGNNIIFYPSISNVYPYQINYKDGKTINFTYSNGYLSRINIGSFIYIQFSGSPINQAELNYNGYLSRYLIGYENNRIKQVNNIIYYNNVETFKNTAYINSLTYSDNEITIEDKIQKEKIIYTLSNGYVTNVGINKYLNGSTTKNIIINYVDNYKTSVTDYLGLTTNYYFDSNGNILFEKDYLNIVRRNYFNDRNLLIHKTTDILTLPKKEGYISSNVDSFNVSGVTRNSYQISTSDDFYDILGMNIYEVSGNGYLYKNVNINGITGECFIFIMFVKNLSNGGNLNVTLSYGSYNKEVNLTENNVTGYFELVVVGIKLEESTTTLQIRINVENKDIIIGGLQLLKKDFGIYYTYNNDNDVIEKLDISGKITYEYNIDKLVSQETYPDNYVINYLYDSFKNYKISQITNNEGTKFNYEYTSNNYNENKIKIGTTSSDVRIEEEKSYDSDDLFLTNYKDDLNNQRIIQYNSKKLREKITNPDGSMLEYEYDNDDYISKIIEKTSNINGVYSRYTYIKPLLQTVTPLNNSEKRIEYNSNNDIYHHYSDGYVVSERLYSNYLLSQNKYGLNSDSFNFIYDSEKRITDIKYQNVNSSSTINKYKFTYNGPEISNIEIINNYIKTYTYNQNSDVTRISSANFTYDYAYNTDRSLSSKKLKTNGYTKIYAFV